MEGSHRGVKERGIEKEDYPGQSMEGSRPSHQFSIIDRYAMVR